jgi:hypothetical protein
MIMLAPTASGKTTWISSLLLDPEKYGKCWTKLIIATPSADIDSAWDPVKKELKKRGYDPDECFFSTWNEQAIGEQLDEFRRKVQALKDKGTSNLPSCIVVVDDFSDSPQVLHARGKNLLDSIAVRGRHSSVSLLVSCQKMTTLSAVVRTQARAWFVGRLRSEEELKAWASQVSALLPKKMLLDVYRAATASKYSFLFVNLTADTLNSTFWQNLEKPFIFE